MELVGWAIQLDKQVSCKNHGCLPYDLLSIDLLWRPLGCLVRFVFVDHPTRGKIILMSTLLSLEPLAIIELYGYRFKIEFSCKQALHTSGTYAYHF